MDPRELHEFEQNMAGLLETLPHFLYSFYKRLMAEGFNDEQAMAFTIEWLRITLHNAMGKPDDRRQSDGNTS